MAFGVRAFTGTLSRSITLRLLAGCVALCFASAAFAAGFAVHLTGGLYSFISIPGFTTPLALGCLAVLWLRLFGFPTIAPLRSGFEQRVVCLSLIWGFLGVYTLTLVSMNVLLSDRNTPLSSLLVSAGVHCVENTFLLLVTAWGCTIFPSWDRLFTHKFRIATDISHEDLTRISWHLSQRGIKQVVNIVPIGGGAEWLSRGAFAGFDALVTSKQTLSTSDRSLPVLSAFLCGLPVLDVEHFATLISRRIDLGRLEIDTVLAMAPRPSVTRLACDSIKRALEPAMSAVLALVLAPLMALVAIAVKLSSPGPIIFRQVRAGYGGKNFTLLKFRTMRTDAEASGPQWSSTADSRVTPVGGFLRATRLDELPQLWNVIAGELSFIGPRPERPEMVAKLIEDIPTFPLRTAIRPGITGWAQVRAGYAASVDESLSKLEYDLYYGLYSSFVFDVEIILRTAAVAIFGDRQAQAKEERSTMQALVEESAGRWARQQQLVSGQ